MAYFVAAILTNVLVAVPFAAAGATAAGWAATSALATAAMQAAQTLVAAAGIATVYYELRVAKEGIGPSALAAVFD